MRIFLETERLILRRLTPDDVDTLHELDSDPEVMRFLNGGIPTPRSVIEHTLLPAILRAYESEGPSGTWAALERTEGAFLGWFSLRAESVEHPERVSLGYRLRRAAWGQGYATEGAQALIRKCFTELGVERVSATTYQDNLASRHVMEKVGLKLARTYRLVQEDLAASASYVAAGDLWDGDDLEYALLRTEWERLYNIA